MFGLEDDLHTELNNLRRACRAFAKVAANLDVFDEIKPEAMRRVLRARGWFMTGTQPWPGEPNRVAFEVYDHKTAVGEDRGYIVMCVKVPMEPSSGDWKTRVHEWATAVAIRHGDVSPAEVLAEAL